MNKQKKQTKINHVPVPNKDMRYTKHSTVYETSNIRCMWWAKLSTKKTPNIIILIPSSSTLIQTSMT